MQAFVHPTDNSLIEGEWFEDLAQIQAFEAELKPCPFCGGKGRLATFFDRKIHETSSALGKVFYDVVKGYIFCDVCRNQMRPTLVFDVTRREYDCRESFKAIWNTRYEPEKEDKDMIIDMMPEVTEIAQDITVLSNTTEDMCSDDYRRRFIAEYNQLVLRYNALRNLVIAWDRGELPFTPKSPRNLLLMQLDIMYRYITVLQSRAYIEGIPLAVLTTEEPVVDEEEV